VNISGRWRRVKSQKSNLILFVAAVILIVMAPLWRLAVAPALKVVPTDIDLLRFYNGSLFRYVRPPGQAPVGDQPEKLGVTIQQREFSPLRGSTPTVALIEVDTAIIDSVSNSHVVDDKNTYAVNRRSAKQVPDSGSNRNRSGYHLVFPFNTPREDLPIWDELTGKTQKGAYSGQRTVNGAKAYLFKVEYGGQPVAPPPGFPTDMTGAQLKSILSRPGLPLGDSDVIRVAYKGNQSVEYLVEPTAGNLVSTRNVQESVYLSIDDPARGIALTQVITKLDYSETQASEVESATFASDEIKKLRLQFVYLPVMFLALGIGCLLVSLFALEKQ
jgi:hypothetical protein